MAEAEHILISLPDCKPVHPLLEIGKAYTFLQRNGNGVMIQTSDPETRIWILESRFES